MSKQSRKKTPAQSKKKAHEVYERVYNTCLSYGFTPWDENDPYKPGSALVQTARITQKKREKIHELLGENLIIENLANYNHEKPHELFRALRQAGIDLMQPSGENEGEILTTLIDPEDMSEDELRKNFKEYQRALLQTQQQIKSKETSLKEQQSLVRELRGKNKILTEKAKTTDAIYAELLEQFIRPVNCAPYPYIVRDDEEQPLIACGILSDLHMSEWVSPEEVMGISAYNPDIAQERLRQFTEGFIKICDDHASHKTVYQGVVLNIAGDIISGLIHAELVFSLKNGTQVEMHIVTARAAGSLMRVITTLDAWKCETKGLISCGSTPKAPQLENLKADIFFDDSERHLANLPPGTLGALVPWIEQVPYRSKTGNKTVKGNTLKPQTPRGEIG